MSRIISLEGLNFKGINGVIELTGRDLLDGPCGSRKSAAKQMMQFVTLGKVDGFSGKSGDRLFELCSDPNKKEMAVTLVNDENFIFSRKITKNVKPLPGGGTKITYKTSYECTPDKGEKNDADYKQRLLEELGINDLMFSLDSFYHANNEKQSAPDQKRFVMKLSNMNYDEYNLDTLRSTLEHDLLSKELEENDIEQYNNFKSCIEQVLSKYAKKDDIEQNINSLLGVATKHVATWKKNESTALAATDKLTQIKNSIKRTSRGLIEDLEKKEKAEKLLITHSTEQQQNISNIDDNKNLVEEIAVIVREIEINKELKNPDDIAAIQTSIDSIKLVRPLAPNFEAEDIIKIEISAEISDLKDKVKDIDVLIKEETGTKTELDNDIKMMKHKTEGYYGIKIRDFNKKIDSFNVNIEKLSSGKCPIIEGLKCETDFGPTIDSFKTQIETIKNDIAKVTEAQNNHIQDIEKEEVKLKNSDNKIKILVGEKDHFSGEIKKRQETIDGIDKDIKSVNDKYIKLSNVFNIDTSRVNKLKDDINKANTFETRKEEYLKNKNNELVTARAKEPKAVKPVEFYTSMIETTKTTIEELKNSIKDKEAAKLDLQNQQSSIIDVKEAEQKHMAYRRIKKLIGIEGILGEILKQGLDPIRDDITRILEILGIPYTFFFDTMGPNSKPYFNFGWITEFGEKRSFDAISEGERLILTTAILVAFINKIGGSKCKILTVDNINHLDRDLLFKYTQGLAKLGFDNILISGIVGDRIGTWVGEDEVKTLIVPEVYNTFKVNRL